LIIPSAVSSQAELTFKFICQFSTEFQAELFLLHFIDNFTVLNAELKNNELCERTFIQGLALCLREDGNYGTYNVFMLGIFILKRKRAGYRPTPPWLDQSPGYISEINK
jgi:hypothetical protein